MATKLSQAGLTRELDQRVRRAKKHVLIASPFLAEMPQSELDINDYSKMGGGSRSSGTGGGGYQWPGASRPRAEGEMKSPYKPDQRVRHPRFRDHAHGPDRHFPSRHRPFVCSSRRLVPIRRQA